MKKRYTITATALDKSGKVIHSCNNSYSESSALMRYYAMKAGEPLNVYDHAEIKCISVAALTKRRKIHTLIVFSYDVMGNRKNAKPCKICQLAIQDFNIRKVIYSTEEGMQELCLNY